jgi:hypothetical protein
LRQLFEFSTVSKFKKKSSFRGKYSRKYGNLVGQLTSFSIYIFQDTPEDTPDNNEAAPEEEPKEESSNHNLGIALYMFSRILNLQTYKN